MTASRTRRSVPPTTALAMPRSSRAGRSAPEARCERLNEAYDCLKDPQKRAASDRFGHAAFQQGGPFGGGGGHGPGPDISDIFSSIFGAFMDPRGARPDAGRGAAPP